MQLTLAGHSGDSGTGGLKDANKHTNKQGAKGKVLKLPGEGSNTNLRLTKLCVAILLVGLAVIAAKLIERGVLSVVNEE